jgi:hypothetical protein
MNFSSHICDLTNASNYMIITSTMGLTFVINPSYVSMLGPTYKSKILVLCS